MRTTTIQKKNCNENREQLINTQQNTRKQQLQQHIQMVEMVDNNNNKK